MDTRQFSGIIERLRGIGFSDIEKAGGKPYLVGGCVRDMLMGRAPKDIDVIIDGMSMPVIAEILVVHGSVSVVGKSFGVLKFTRDNETIDVAVPRADLHVDGGGHRSVRVSTDSITLMQDMFRRDFTINAMAVGFDLEAVDPTGGEGDLADGVIRCVDFNVFAMDPLRMLRAVVFAARFKFVIDVLTMESIRKHAEWISRIPGERFEMELAKAWKEGVPASQVVALLIGTGLYEHMFGPAQTPPHMYVESASSTYSDFFYQVLMSTGMPNEKYAFALNGSSNVATEIECIHYVMKSTPGRTKMETLVILQKAIERAPGVVHSEVLYHSFPQQMTRFLEGSYPRSRHDLAVRGNDVIKAGFKPIFCGYVLHTLVLCVLAGQVPNERGALLEKIRQMHDIDETKWGAINNSK